VAEAMCNCSPSFCMGIWGKKEWEVVREVPLGKPSKKEG
jgi:hypothetical protein